MKRYPKKYDTIVSCALRADCLLLIEKGRYNHVA